MPEADQKSLRKRKDRKAKDGPVPQEKSRYAPQERPGNDGPRSRPPGQDGPQKRPQARRNETTDASLKKRFSMRYAQGDLEDSAPPPMPGMPAIPPQFAQAERRNGTPQASGFRLDKRALRDPNLNPEKYIANFLSNASEQDIAEFTRSLQKEKNRSSTELQANVYQNRTQFIKISKEAEKLKGEMQSLRTMMSDLTTTLSQAAANATPDSALDPSARKRANRSSRADLDALWNTQLQQLWKMIEGSQKYLAAIPGRHVVSESGHWAELDAATWKSRGPIHVVLLNDHLMIAAKKRKRVDTDSPKAQRAHSKLIAIKCWSLSDIDLVDVAKEGDASSQRRAYAQVADAVTVRSNREAFTFRSDRGKQEDKMNLLTQFRRTKDELRRAQQAENKDTGVKAKETQEYLATRDPAISKSAGLLRTLSNAKDRPDIMVNDNEGQPRNLRWVEGQIDNLDIEIALQQFPEAVRQVEALRKLASNLKGNSVAQEIITVKVDERAVKLADMLVRNLTQKHAILSATQENVDHLTRLDFAARARQAYLAARTSTIHTRARQCVFEGDVLAHITNISFVYITLIKNTIYTYQQCFTAAMMSTCMVWAKTELDNFNEALGRALSGVEKGGEVWQQGLKRAKDLARELDEVGVDFVGLVGTGL